MAKLVRCRDCGTMVSRSAAACPKCGRVLKKSSKQYGCCGPIVIVGILGFCTLMLLAMSGRKENLPPPSVPSVPSSPYHTGSIVVFAESDPIHPIVVADDENYFDIHKSGRDISGYQPGKQLFGVTSGVRARVLVALPDRLYVLVLDGPWADRSGWASPGDVKPAK